MNHHITPIPIYVAVLLALVILTFATVGISFLPLSTTWHVALGLTVGTVKATLVLLVFMHVMHSPRFTWAILAVALFWLLILFALTYTDYLTRGLVPGMPGH